MPIAALAPELLGGAALGAEAGGAAAMGTEFAGMAAAPEAAAPALDVAGGSSQPGAFQRVAGLLNRKTLLQGAASSAMSSGQNRSREQKPSVSEGGAMANQALHSGSLGY